MKKGLLLSVLMFLMGILLSVNAQELTVSDVQNSGCLRETRETRAGEYGESRTIILTKEGASLKVQLLNYYSNCGTEGFEVTSNMSGGNNDSPLLLTVGVTPICNADMDCMCLYNVSFTINGVVSNSFYFSCWWCEGTVNLTEGEPLVLEDSWEEVSIDGLDYKIHRVMHSAQLTNGKTCEGELTIPSEVRYEGQKYTVINIISSAFSENTALTSVTIPNSIISIGGSAFYGCTGLTSIIIPESVKKIGYYAFKGCTNLTNITIPNGVTQIGNDAFTGTAWYNNLPDGVVYVGSIAYTYKGTMPEGTCITIKEGTSTINQDAFTGCRNLVSVTIPGSVKTIGYASFWKCSGLTSVTIAEGVKCIGELAFRDCSSLQSIFIPKSVESIGQLAFMNCTGLTSATISEGVTKIGRWAFSDCSNLSSLVISEGVKDLGYYTFVGCSGLTTVTIPSSVTRIGEGVFRGCSGLTSVIISEGVQVIDVDAFAGCSSLTSLTIPSSVTTIYDYAFYRCSTLSDVKCNASVPPVCYDWVFYDVPLASATLHVPAGSVEKYKATAPWNKFGNIVAITEPHQPLSFIEGNPIWVYKYEHIPTPRSDDWMKYWLDTGDRNFTYYFLGRQKEIDGKVYTMMGKVISKDAGELAVNRWYPIREENGIVYTITDSLPGVVGHGYNDNYKIPYLQQGNECVIYNFNAEIGETLYPQYAYCTVESFDTYQLMDGTICRMLKTTWEYMDLYEKLGFVNFDNEYGIIDPSFGMILPSNGHVYVNRLNAYYQDNVMFYKAPDAQEGLCVNDTIWTREDAEAYAPSYKADPRQEEVFSYIRQLQKVSEVAPVTFTEGQMATIILPTTPDASKGKYYRLDRREDDKIIFEEELNPKARVPYIIVPKEDFTIDLSTLDLAGLSQDTVSIKGISFIGSYRSEELESKEGWYIDIIDTTPDCGFSLSGETEKGAFIGALRAYLSWEDPYSQGPTKGEPEKLQIVLHDNGTSLTPIPSPKRDGSVYDLSGRKVNVQFSTGTLTGTGTNNPQLPKGIYIQNGKKVFMCVE